MSVAERFDGGSSFRMRGAADPKTRDAAIGMCEVSFLRRVDV